MSTFHIANIQEPFIFENGRSTNNLKITYSTFGTFQSNVSKVIWVCHALTGNSDVSDWWSGIFGKNKTFDPANYFIICANVIGSCYGTSFEYNEPPSNEIPLITVRDIVEGHERLRKHLNIEKIEVLLGPSLGGQQALEWSILLGGKLNKLILIATNAQHSPYGIAFNETQRMALLADKTFLEDPENGGKEGLKIARAIAMLSYRSYEGYKVSQSEENDNTQQGFRAASYQQYQGEKITKRFTALAYYRLSSSMDSHNVGRGRVSIRDALMAVSVKTLVIGIKTDLLFPIEEQQALAEMIPNAYYGEIESLFGHDGFLIENDQLEKLIKDFLQNDFKAHRPTNFKIKNIEL